MRNPNVQRCPTPRQFDDFEALLLSAQPPSGLSCLASGSLSSPAGTPPPQSEERTIEITKLKEVHPVWRWLTAQHNFVEALKIYERLRSRMPADSQRSPRGDNLLFVRYTTRAMRLMLSLQLARSRTRHARGAEYGPTASNKKKAVRHLKAFVDLLHKGVMGVSLESIELAVELDRVAQSIKTRPRKPRSSQATPELDIIKLLARELYVHCASQSAEILLAIAAVVDVRCSRRTAERYIVEAKSGGGPAASMHH